MNFPRPQFSLRTLILASLAVGGVMLAWRASDAWVLHTYPLIDSSRLHPSGKAAVYPFEVDFLADNETILFQPASIRDYLQHTRCALRLSDGEVLESWPKATSIAVHPTRGVIATALFPKTQVLEFPEKKVLAEMETGAFSQLQFSPSGQYLLRKSFNRIEIRHSKDFGLASAVELGQSTDRSSYLALLSPDERFMAVTSTGTRHKLRTAFSTAETYRKTLEMYDVKTGALKWRWIPEDFAWFEIEFERDGSAITALIVEQSDTWDKNHRFKLKYDIRYRLDTATGVRKSHEAVEHTETAAPKALDQCFSRDNELRCEPSKDAKAVRVLKHGALSWSAGTGGPAIVPYSLNISPDKRYLLACLDNGSLAIWTRTRGHLEWWGIYERPETWLAIVLIGALAWSVGQDWRRAS